MGRRRHNADFADLLIGLAKLPWWASLVVGGMFYFPIKLLFIPMLLKNKPFDLWGQMLEPYAEWVWFPFILTAVFGLLNSWRKRRLLEQQSSFDSLRAISWREFEELVGEAYRRQGYFVTELGGDGPDGGVDLVLQRGGEKILVQCKHWKMRKVGVKIIRELYGVMTAQHATQGIVISSGRFTEEAAEFAKNKPLELVPGEALLKLIESVKTNPKPPAQPLPLKTSPPVANTTRKPPAGSAPAPTSTTAPECPLCGKLMTLRQARQGPNAGKNFWGCSGFPGCKGIRNVV